MAEFFSYLMGMGFIILLAILLVAIAIYVLVGLLLNSFNKQVEGKGTALAWIPILNTYLLGKLLLNKGFGWALLIAQIAIMVLTSTGSVTVNDTETSTFSILKEPASTIVSSIWGAICLALIIWAIVKYFKIKKSPASTNNVNTGLNNFQNISQTSNPNQNPNQNHTQNINQYLNQNPSNSHYPNTNQYPNQTPSQTPNQTSSSNPNNPNSSN